jgi:hypothetical protein
MSFDYKTLHAIVAELPPTMERYCPECGQSLTTLAEVPIGKPTSRPWWWVLLVVGIYLAVTSGLRALSDYQMVAHPDQLPHLTGLVNVEDGSPAKQLLPYLIGQLDRDLLVGAGGLVLVLLGLGSVARQRVMRDHPAHVGVSRAFLGWWGSAEALLISLFSLVLLLFGYLLVSELIAGETLTLALTAETASRTVDVILFTAELVAAGKPGS